MRRLEVGGRSGEEQIVLLDVCPSLQGRTIMRLLNWKNSEGTLACTRWKDWKVLALEPIRL